MIRLTLIVLVLAAGIGPLAPRANAQSPNPALLAPPGGRAGLAAPQSVPRTSYASPKPGGTPPIMKSRRGHHLSHPRVHGL